ncbi:DUF397 domain-containing protein [Streptomyces sp. NPDC053048]|uniref:DUF397 domain-containing protein n=1 Tax=Streptomyces sp. NPDC053048 TaxID=3365694 RepID=UPI0037D515ED
MSELQWQKSSFSGPDGANGECIEVATGPTGPALRESDRPQAVLTLAPSSLRALLEHARQSRSAALW